MNLQARLGLGVLGSLELGFQVDRLGFVVGFRAEGFKQGFVASDCREYVLQLLRWLPNPGGNLANPANH